MLLESYINVHGSISSYNERPKEKSASGFWEFPPGTSQLKVPAREKERSPFGKAKAGGCIN